MHRSHYVEGTELHFSDLDPKVKVIGKKVGICDGVPLTAALFQNILNTHISNTNKTWYCMKINWFLADYSHEM